MKECCSSLLRSDSYHKVDHDVYSHQINGLNRLMVSVTNTTLYCLIYSPAKATVPE